MKLLIDFNGKPGELDLERQGESCRFGYRSGDDTCARYEASVVQVEPGIFSILVNGRSYEVKVAPAPEGYYVDLGGRRSVVDVRDPRSISRRGASGFGEGRQTVSAPMPGKVVRVLAALGDEVEAGAGLVVVEAMKMQNELKAPKAGRVVQLKAELGATVAQGEILAAVE